MLPPASSSPCLPGLFEAQAARTPDAVAVACGAEQLTYRELNTRANQLAHRLRALGVGPEVLVGLFLERSLDLLVGIVGILKAGGAYVPVDRAYPRERIAFVLGDAQVAVLVTQQALAADIDAPGAKLVCLDADARAIAAEPDSNPAAVVQPDQLAYVIYTSGSTGKPKGSLITHRNVVRLFSATRPWFEFGPAEVWTLFHSCAFDFSVWEIWGALLHGGRLVVVPYDVSRSPEAFHQLVAEAGVTVLNQTPAAFRQFMQADAAAGARPLALRCVIFGGEALEMQSLRPWFDRHGDRTPQLVNMYGITETTVHVTYRALTRADLGAGSVIGVPIPDLQVHLLDEELQPVPPGVAGEIHVGGAGVGRGYLRRPELTQAKFIPDPFSSRPGALLYRSGDLARRLENGELEYLGRIDDQVKIRGFRIELGEIESVLLQHPAVREAVVLAREDTPGEKRLVAWLVPAASPPAPDELRAHLRKHLPDYMAPAAFVWLDRVPLTAHGKVDRRALPAPRPERPSLATRFAAPRNEHECKLAAIWAGVLRLERVGMDDNFFELGGDSLLAGKVLVRAREQLGRSFTWAEFYHHPTVAGLAAALCGKEPGAARFPVPAPRAVARDTFPLSSGQQRLWFVEQLSPGNRAYTSQCALRFRGALDVATLERALGEMVRRHAIFRTTFQVCDGQPCQIERAPWQVELPVLDLRPLAEADRAAESLRLGDEAFRRPFDLAAGPPVRWTLHRLRDDEHVLLHHEHHLVHDGWSFRLFVGELLQIHAAFARGLPSPLADPAVQFADFALAESAWLATPAAAEQVEFWRRRLRADVAPLPLPYDHPRPERQNLTGASRFVELPLPLARAVRSLCRREGISLYAMLLAAFQAFLHRATGETLVPIGCAVANRKSSAAETIIGMFVNNTVLQAELAPESSFLALARATRAWTAEAQEHADAPFDRVVNAVGQSPHLRWNPLFQVMFNFHDSPVPDVRVPGLAVELEEVLSSGAAKFDLNVIAVPHSPQLAALGSGRDPESIVVVWEYNTDLFTAATIGQFIERYEHLLAAAVAQPERAIGALPLVDSEALRAQIVAWNATTLAPPPAAGVHELFAEQAARTPTATALVAETGPLSYAELDARANQLARRLHALGVSDGAMVAILLERSIEFVVSVLAILKTGAAYVPLDPEFPAERLHFILSDTSARVLIARGPVAEAIRPAGIIVLDLAAMPPASLAGGEAPFERKRPCAPDAPAYVMYTSGSTGRPKGVVIPHRGIVRLVRGQAYAPFFPGERFLLLASPAFDASTFELWGPLLNGATCVIFPARWPELDQLEQTVRAQGVTCLWLTASLFNQIVDQRPSVLATVPHVLAGGEALSVSHVARALDLHPHLRVTNGYGPTESTTFACTHAIERAGLRSETPIPIGRPIANTTCHILDVSGAPVPAGVPGELHIGGDGLALGYLNQPELTREKFVPDSFARTANARLYRTGDRCRWRGDGTIEFLGRLDDQLKIRGFRIEPGEIAAVLRRHPAVADAAVIAREVSPGNLQLVAYVVPRDAVAVEPDELRAHAGAVLPAYMAPTVFVRLAQLPLTSNGKLDRAALPPPPRETDSGSRELLAPSTSTEVQIARIWCKLLGLEQVGAEENFFALGGHSLLAMQMISQLHHSLSVAVPLRAVFEAPTLAQFAARIDELNGAHPPAAADAASETDGVSIGATSVRGFLARLRSSGVDLTSEGANLRFRAPVGVMTPELRAEIARRKPEILRLLTAAADEPLTEAIPLIARDGALPLSHDEQRLWFLQHALRDPSIYNVFTAARIRGPLDSARLRRAFAAVMQRHEILRTGYDARNGAPIRQVATLETVPFEFSRLTGRGGATLASALEPRMNAEAARAFDLAAPPLWRVVCLELAADDHVLVLTAHHIICDEWSLQLWRREVETLYAASDERGGPALPALPVQFADFAAWQNRRVASRALDASRRYWRAQLQGASIALELPFDRPRAQPASHQGAVCTVALAPAVREALERLGGAEQATSFVVWLAAFAAWLHRVSRQRDFVIGTPLAARERPEVQALIGFFLNTLPIRERIEDGASFRSLLRRNRALVLDAFEHGALPLDEIVAARGADSAAKDASFFSVMFVLHDRSRRTWRFSGTTAEPYEGARRTAKAELTLFLAPARGGAMEAAFEFSSDVFERASIERIAAQFARLLESITSQPDAPLESLELLPADQRRQILAQSIPPPVPYPRDSSVHALFEQIAAATPDAPAVILGARVVSYRELDRAADELASQLRANGVAPGDFVGVLLDRSIEFVVSVLAILKSGAAYVPLNTDFPAERVRLILEDAGVRIVITRGAPPAAVRELGVRVIDLARKREATAAPAARNESAPRAASDAAYVMYTSGSTGRPKGVVVAHRGIVRLVRGQSYTPFTREQRFLLLSSLAFDASTFELWGALLNGAACVIFPARWPELEPLERTIREHGVTCLWLTAGLFNHVIDERPSLLATVQQVITGGEVLSAPHVRRALELQPHLRLTNGYGPTETTTFACTHAIDRATLGASVAIPIGRPIAHTACYILDSSGQLAPIGAPGELHIGGDGVAAGYLRRPELTAEKFIADPFAATAGARMYRTGDRCRWLPDGTIEFLGRLDDQIKVRGFRIEPGEVETALARLPGVAQAAVAMSGHGAGATELVAYLVPRNGSLLSAEILRGKLAQQLPDYMVPARYAVVPQLPLNANGKVDRRALLTAGHSELESGPAYVAPRHAMEVALVRIWQRVLNRERVGVHDNFFEIGGTSLIAMRLMHEIHAEFGQSLLLLRLFASPTIAALAAELDLQSNSGNRAGGIALRGSGAGTPLFHMPGYGGFGFLPATVTQRLQSDRTFFDGLQHRGLDGLQPPFEEVELIAADLIAQMRMIRPHGPYCLTGYCYGGVVAYEVAQQLTALGETVTGVVLWDSYPARSTRRRALREVLGVFRRQLLELPWRARPAFLAERLSYLKRAIHPPRADQVTPLPGVIEGLAASHRATITADLRAAGRYLPRPYSGNVLLLRTTKRTRERITQAPLPLGGWDGLLRGKFSVVDFACEHLELLQEPAIGAAAERMAEFLRQADEHAARRRESSTASPNSRSAIGVG